MRLPSLSLGTTPRLVTMIVLAVGLFVFSWLFRFNDPNGSFAGLTDDHFFYLIRGWQILYGDLPVRDFVDHGAPLFYYIGAAVQGLFGRGTLSELAFTVTMLSLSAVLTFLIATRASGSVLAGFAGAAFQVLLAPRFYNYPKLLVYVIAIPLIWRYANAPSVGRIAWVAAATVIGFLFRHDHGVFVGIAMMTLVAALTHLSLKERLRHAVVYVALCALFLSPYLLFIETNGGVASYLQQASAWAERDRDRAPVEWPGLFDNPDGVSAGAVNGWPFERVVAVVRDNGVAWLYYLEILLPLLALALLLVSADGFRPDWPLARAKMLSVVVLGAALDVGFLRSPIEARLADPSVPLAILVAWLPVALLGLIVTKDALVTGLRRYQRPLQLVLGSAGLLLFAVLAVTMSDGFYERLDSSAMTDRWGKPFERVDDMTVALKAGWQLESLVESTDEDDMVGLALYINACTEPEDRVLVQAYIPQILALARRAFAGGHADLRPGFFGTEDAQRLTLDRLRSQSVPIVLLETGQSYRNFRNEFPLITDYLDQQYVIVGTRDFNGRNGTTLLVRWDAEPRGTYAPFDWPCYGSGRVQS